jgi:hypothetical protein
MMQQPVANNNRIESLLGIVEKEGLPSKLSGDEDVSNRTLCILDLIIFYLFLY